MPLSWSAFCSRAVLSIFLSVLTVPSAHSGEWSGYVSGEFRLFNQDPLDPLQHGNNLSVAFQPEWYQTWDNEKQSLTIAPFIRLDEGDDQRSHADIRELTWLRVSDDWELRLGIRKLFWGVTESQHLVDIINQIDLVENPDGEDKLGQPMINLAMIKDWGTVDLFVFPYFRERTFPGINGRLRTPLRVDTDQAVYESGKEERHVDYAIRWSHSLGGWDIGLSHFNGTSREPRFQVGLDSGGLAVLVPYYDLIQQTGLDLQATYGAWLWKLEAINRRVQGGAYIAATGGLEYSFYGVMGSVADIGVVLEYLYDDRGDQANSPFEGDIMTGLRLTLNDAQSTELLVGVIVDVNENSRVYSLEASRRLGQRLKLVLEARMYSSDISSDPLSALDRDDYLQMELAYFF